jgi:hypothetical protein
MLAALPVAHLEKLQERGFPDDLIEQFVTQNGKPPIVSYLTAAEIQHDWLDRFPSLTGNPGGALLLRFNESTLSLKPDKPDWDERHQRFKKYLYAKNNTATPGANVQPWLPPAHLGEPQIATEGLFDALACTYLIGIPCAAITAPSHLRGSKLPSSVTTYVSDADVPYHHHLGLLSTVISQGREQGLLLAHLPRNPHASYAVTDRIGEDCKWGMEEWCREWRQQGLDPKEELESVIKAARKPAEYLRRIINDYATTGLKYPVNVPTLSNAARAIADAAATASEVTELSALLEHNTKAKAKWIDGQIKHRMQRRVQKGLPVAIETLDSKAKELALQVSAAAIYDDPEIAAHKRVFHLQQRAAELEIRGFSKIEATRYFHDVRRQREGSLDPLRKGDKLDRSPVQWAWEGILRYGTSNLVSALPKVGKTNLITQLLADWHQAKGQFLGRALHGVCPPIVIAGPDMNDGDWYAPLLRAGMVEEDGSINDPILALYTAKHRFSLDPDGIEGLVALAEERPGYLLLIDSYHAAIRGLGISEKDEGLADPLIDAQQALAPYGVTIVVVHHSGKGSTDGSATTASRGSTSLPGATSMNVSLSRKQQDNPLKAADPKITIKAEGRSNSGAVEILVEQTDHGWVLHGNAADLDLVDYVSQQMDELTSQQENAIEDIAKHWNTTGTGMTAQHLADALNLSKANKDPRKAGQKILDALEKRGLVSKCGTAKANGSGGRPSVLYQPHPSVAAIYPCSHIPGVLGAIGVFVHGKDPNDPLNPQETGTEGYRNADQPTPEGEPPDGTPFDF